MKRRLFMAAAAGLGLAPDNSGESQVDIREGSAGGRGAYVKQGAPVFGALELPPEHSEETTVSVSGYAYDDEPGDVEITATINGATVYLTLAPDRAREFAEEIQVAAREADHDVDGGDV